MSARPVDAARWLIAVAKDAGRPLTNFQVQKLLYYAHGEYLSKYGEPLFADGFQAWDHGPVCPPVYRAFSDFGSDPIVNVPADRERMASKIDPAELAALERAWADYGDWSISELWDDVHRPESPWEGVYVAGKDNTTISDQSIREYFTDLQSPRLRRSMNRLRKRRDERGDLPGETIIGDAGLAKEIEAWRELRAAGTHGLLG
ncbi:Panacea domain-containing protein [Mycolicibacterium vanbaalenii]|uniref:Panacea domain-containing protein n=1 Tax=Mycolicibacterium vanbaalenii TaxID=110539 RepID=UPI001330ACDC|nr:type II toxin-antitoxin system antitoxin SocA domain-containing protein [Mycolicibacterium vanbaalenii]